ncbi:PREDICTED: putative ankyrin repeat domain-containing protein 30B-like isoform X3 [Rhinopithecus bieti]|uniref:putative ankyrin repeat domain-containing protein 30B-like isoform X3 n=1 Tax=Rhinopithecus bieti TaxID=61621 RepID=UPI00083BFECE|nr:PREDICTED: putative ankyrin repeat domain-containing protein 30B-like isoform X3 [Rhinopithecus bieti]
MKRLSAACVKGETGPERPSPFSQLVYTKNDSYVIHHGDLRKIHKAAFQGQAWKLERMMKKTTMDLNIKDAKKRTALHWACFNGHAEVVTLLVDRKCQLDVLDGENRTPLMKAGHTPLLLAIRKRSEQIVEFLLTKNANANAVDKFKCTALMLAVCHGSSEIVCMLLQQNVDICAEDTCGMTAERYAVACGFNLIHQQLLEYKQKISKNSQNSNPEGTSEGTPEEATPLAERTPGKAEGSVEGTPDE